MARIVSIRFHVLFEAFQACLEAGHVVTNGFDVVAKPVGLITAGNSPTFLLQKFAQVLPKRAASFTAPVGNAARQLPDTMGSNVADDAGQFLFDVRTRVPQQLLERLGKRRIPGDFE